MQSILSYSAVSEISQTSLPSAQELQGSFSQREWKLGRSCAEGKVVEGSSEMATQIKHPTPHLSKMWKITNIRANSAVGFFSLRWPYLPASLSSSPIWNLLLVEHKSPQDNRLWRQARHEHIHPRLELTCMQRDHSAAGWSQHPSHGAWLFSLGCPIAVWGQIEYKQWCCRLQSLRNTPEDDFYVFPSVIIKIIITMIE